MRVLLLSALVAFLDLAFGVLAHHTITTGRSGLGFASLLAACLVSSGLCAIAVRAAKNESRLWPKMGSGILLLGMACTYLQMVASDYFPAPLKVMHAIDCVVLCFWAILLLVSRHREYPHPAPVLQSPDPRPAASSPARSPEHR